MNDEEYRDYQDLSPDPKEGIGFQYWTERLINEIRRMSPSTDFQKGTATAITEEFRRLDDVLKKLSPEAGAELTRREQDYIKNEWLKPGMFREKPVDPETMGGFKIEVQHGDRSAG